MKSLIYMLLRLSNDINAISRGQYGKRVKRKYMGKMFSRLLK